MSDQLPKSLMIGIIQNIHMSPIPKTGFLVETFFCYFFQQDSSSPTKGENLLRFRNVISPIARREIIEEIIFPKKVLVLSKSKNIYMERQK